MAVGEDKKPLSLRDDRFMKAFEKPETAAYLLVPAIMILGLLTIGSPSVWFTLTLAGLAMGLIFYVMASGLTLIFGLLDVMHFGHGAFVSIGAYIGAAIGGVLATSVGGETALGAILSVLGAMVVAGAATGVVGIVFERLLMRPVYGDHLKQMLVTTGALLVMSEIIIIVWGAQEFPMRRPDWLVGGVRLGDVVVEKFRIVAMVVGITVFTAQLWVLRRTRTGLLIRAGVENREMVQSLGYPIARIFLIVFVVGSALAGLGGVIWGYYAQLLTAQIGLNMTITLFIAIIVGGIGSVEGCLIATLAIGLISNYVGYQFPKLDLISTIALLLGVLLWRGRGLLPQNAS